MKTTNRWEKIGILSGLIGPLVIGTGMLVAALTYVGIEGQSYSLRNHYVSELGEVGVSQAAWAFNSGLLLGGVFTTIFIIYLAYQLTSWLRYPMGLIGVIATVNGALVGFYPMNNLSHHIFVAMNFFNLGMLISFLYSLIFLFSKKHPFPRWMAIPGFINAGLFTWFLNFPTEADGITQFQEGMRGLVRNRPDVLPMAMLEWAVILGILVWVFSMALYLYFQGKAQRSE